MLLSQFIIFFEKAILWMVDMYTGNSNVVTFTFS